MKANADNYPDVEKYFAGTYIVVPEVDPHKIYLLVKAKPEGVIVREPDTFQEGLISFEGGFEYTIQCPLVNKKRWFMHGDMPVLITRIPARMWKKGIHPENTLMFTFDAVSNLKPLGLKPNILESMLKQEIRTKPTFMENVVLSPQFAFCKKNNLLYFWDVVVGKVAKRTRQVFLPRELYDIQLPEALNAYNITRI